MLKANSNLKRKINCYILSLIFKWEKQGVDVCILAHYKTYPSMPSLVLCASPLHLWNLCPLSQHGVQTGGGGKQCTAHEKQPYHLVMRKTELGNTLCL